MGIARGKWSCAACRYGGEHKAPELQEEAVYGLTELNREAVRSARLVANPGCYPTSVQLPLSPLLQVRTPLQRSLQACREDITLVHLLSLVLCTCSGSRLLRSCRSNATSNTTAVVSIQKLAC